MKNTLGIGIATLIIVVWGFSLYYLLTVFEVNFAAPITYVFILLQTHLYTGLFITAHDAMHHVVCANRKLNHGIGRLAALLFAFNSYTILLPKHHEHHRFVATDKDPDYHEGNFWVWYYHFAKEYITWKQLLAMAVAFNLLKLVFPQTNIILFWILPSIFATFQLFYFGTYLPHRNPPDNEHHARSQAKNHLWAFVSCYFFGYHYEHHDSPNTPWWLLWQAKNETFLASKHEK